MGRLKGKGATGDEREFEGMTREEGRFDVVQLDLVSLVARLRSMFDLLADCLVPVVEAWEGLLN